MVRFGRLTVQNLYGRRRAKNGVNNYFWNCLCDCGRTSIVRGNSLTGKRTTSCGCVQMENVLVVNRTHGQSYSPEYYTWKGMIQRCTNPNSEKFAIYGARGITVCERWLNSFEAFYEDMGPRPIGLSIERRENEKGYSLENCEWASRSTQQHNTSQNRRITFNGKTQCLVDWSLETGLKEDTITMRIKRGWPVERALTMTARPVRSVITQKPNNP